MRLLNRFSSDDLLGGIDPFEPKSAFDPLLAARFANAALTATLGGLLDMPALLKIHNHEPPLTDVRLQYKPTETPAQCLTLIAQRLDPAILAYERGVEFDLELQRLFEEKTAKIWTGLFPQNKKRKTLIDLDAFELSDPFLSEIAGRLLDKVMEIRESSRKRFESRVRARFERTLAQYAWFGATLTIRCEGLRLTDGFAASAKIKGEVRRHFAHQESWEKAGATAPASYTEYRNETGQVFFPLHAFDLATVMIELERTTGVRALVEEAICRVENAAPAERAGRARWGEAGAWAGGKIDDAVLQMLCERMMAEQKSLPSGSLRLILARPCVSDEIKARLRVLHPAALIVPMKPGQTVLQLGDLGFASPLFSIASGMQ